MVQTRSMSNAPRRVITMKELEENMGKNGTYWTAIKGVVYDFTTFVVENKHPGGDIIRLAAGRDGTCLFESHHSDTMVNGGRVEKYLDSFKKIGQLEGYVQTDDTFYQVVRKRCEAELEKNGLTRHSYQFIALLEVVFWAVVYAVFLYRKTMEGSLWAACVVGFATARLGFMMHMGNHNAISSSQLGNKIAGWMHNYIGASHVCWRYEHQVAHHCAPNEVGLDNDCSIGSPILRFHPDIEHKTFQRFNRVATLAGITVGFWKWFVSDFVDFINQQIGSAKFVATGQEWVQLFFFKAVWLVTQVILPVHFWGWKWGIFLTAVQLALGAHYLENVFLVNHIQPDTLPVKGEHWAVQQVRTTTDWASASPFWNWFSGGLNHQIEHHMFPSMSHWVYPTIAPIVRETCAEFKIPYVNFKSAPEAWFSMLDYLDALGANDLKRMQNRQVKTD